MIFIPAGIDLFEFEGLQQLVVEQGLETDDNRASLTSGEKSVGDLLTFEVATTSLATVTLIFQVLKFWINQNHNCSATLDVGGSTVTLNGLTLEEARSWYLEHSSNGELPCATKVHKRSGL